MEFKYENKKSQTIAWVRKSGREFDQLIMVRGHDWNGAWFRYPNNLGLINNLWIEAFRPQANIKTFSFYMFLQAVVIMSLRILIVKDTIFFPNYSTKL